MRASLIILLFSTYSIFSQNILTDTVFHKVERKETLFSISEKYKIKINDLLNLNPQLRESKLRRNSTILIPVYKTQELEDIVNEDIKNTEQDEMVELVITSLDSIYMQKKKRNNKLNISVLLPFRSSNLNFNSIKEVESLLVDRNLYTIALDLYSGILHAINDLKKMGISINLNVFDTDNSLNKILEISNSEKIRNSDLIIGPLLPRNFETFSAIDFLEGIPKVFPLSNLPIKILKGVIQTVTPRNLLREKMIEYLDINIDRDENIVIIADSLNLDIKNKLTSIFPNSIKIKPEFEGYVLPELLDSLLVDSLPNKVIVESEIFTLVSSIVSQLNSQITPERDVRLYTTYKGNQYDDPSIDIKNLGDLRFTYPSISKKIRSDSITDFKENYKDFFGSLPNSDVVRGYDITKDIVLRILLDNNINKTVKYGEQTYNESKFLYKKDTLGGLFNSSIYILKHFDYDIEEINQ
jgi:LysM repeat protein